MSITPARLSLVLEHCKKSPEDLLAHESPREATDFLELSKDDFLNLNVSAREVRRDIKTLFLWNGHKSLTSRKTFSRFFFAENPRDIQGLHDCTDQVSLVKSANTDTQMKKEHAKWHLNHRPLLGNEPVILRTWQKFCTYIPFAYFFSWTVLLFVFGIFDPLVALGMCGFGMFWGVVEHVRICVFGGYGLSKVLAEREPIFTISAQAQDVQHVVFIAAYKEALETLENTFESIARQTGCIDGKSYAQKHIGVVLCLEEREGDPAVTKAEILEKKFKTQFRFLKCTFHPEGIFGDVQGKGSNIHWAFEQLRPELTHLSSMSTLLVSVADADSEYHLEYFAHMAERFSKCDQHDREGIIFQPTILHFKNYFSQIALIRAGNLICCFTAIAYIEDFLTPGFPFSTYTMSFNLLTRINQWDADFIADDWHSGNKLLLTDPDRAKIEHVPLPVVNYAVECDSYWSTLHARWLQAKRHALGAEEIVYMLQMLPVTHARIKDEEENKNEINPSDTNLTKSRCLTYWSKSIGSFLFMAGVHFRIGNIFVEMMFTTIFFGALLAHTIGLVDTSTLNWPMVHPEDSIPDMWSSPIILFMVVMGFILVCTLVFIYSSMIRVAGSDAVAARIHEAPKSQQWWSHSTALMILHDVSLVATTGQIVFFFASLAEIFAFCRIAWLSKGNFQYFTAPKPVLEERRTDAWERG